MSNNIEKHLRQTIKTLQEENKRLKQDLHDCEFDHQHWEACEEDMDELRAENHRLKAAIMALIGAETTWSIEVDKGNKYTSIDNENEK